jgi:hypothetical protein
MDAWRIRLLANWELILDDDEEDEGNLNLLLDVGIDNEDEVILSRVLGGSRLGKTLNIDRNRHKMHERMMKGYFSDTLSMVLIFFDGVIACNDHYF